MIPSASPGGDKDAASSGAPGEGDEEEIQPELAQMDDPIVGVESKNSTHPYPQPKPLTSHPTMPQAENDKHDLTHQPPRRGCAIGAASRTPNTGHFQSHVRLRSIPLLVGDYCFMRSPSGDVMLTVLVMRL